MPICYIRLQKYTFFIFLFIFLSFFFCLSPIFLPILKYRYCNSLPTFVIVKSANICLVKNGVRRDKF